jgi:L-ascorbate metabolism protein UlaG (beta-lactamase superfamily)
MDNSFIITWHGHSCFSVTYDQFTMVIDPYKDNTVPGLTPLSLFADEVYTTHEHGDHNYVEAVTIRDNDRTTPFRLTRIPCAHDTSQGRRRGLSDIILFEKEGLRFAHFGDVGEELGDDKIENLKNLDAVMIPVGGCYTIGAEEAKKLIDRITPRVVIPMHYRTERYGFDELQHLDEFLALCDDVKRYEESSIEITPETPAQTAVLTYE